MAGKTNLGNAAFFAIKGLKKDIEDLKNRVNELEQKLKGNVYD